MLFVPVEDGRWRILARSTEAQTSDGVSIPPEIARVLPVTKRWAVDCLSRCGAHYEIRAERLETLMARDRDFFLAEVLVKRAS